MLNINGGAEGQTVWSNKLNTCSAQPTVQKQFNKAGGIMNTGMYTGRHQRGSFCESSTQNTLILLTACLQLTLKLGAGQQRRDLGPCCRNNSKMRETLGICCEVSILLMSSSDFYS